MVCEAMLLAGEAAARFAVERSIPFPFATQAPPDTRDLPPGLAGMFALRRCLQPAQLRSVPSLHAGLGLELYAQCTSPLRRYLDLVVHQQLRAYLRGTDLLDQQKLLERVGAAEAISRSARQAGRLAARHWALVYLRQQEGWQGGGVLVDRRGRGAIVLIPELGLEARVYLGEDCPLDSKVALVLASVDLAQLEAHFQASILGETHHE